MNTNETISLLNASMNMKHENLTHMQVSCEVVENRNKEGVVIPHQCHGTRLVRVINGSEDLTDCDALSTTNRDLVLGVLTADCTPICFADKEKVAVLHAGWRGLCDGIIEVVREQFQSSDVEVWVGPHIKRFEIQKDECYEIIHKAFGNEFLTNEDERLVFEFSKAVASRLPDNTIWDGRNTYDDKVLPSYRRDGHVLKSLLTMIKKV